MSCWTYHPRRSWPCGRRSCPRRRGRRWRRGGSEKNKQAEIIEGIMFPNMNFLMWNLNSHWELYRDWAMHWHNSSIQFTVACNCTCVTVWNDWACSFGVRISQKPEIVCSKNTELKVFLPSLGSFLRCDFVELWFTSAELSVLSSPRRLFFPRDFSPFSRLYPPTSVRSYLIIWLKQRYNQREISVKRDN